ncbi:MAG: hypothetical protein PHV82_19300 [Victivallaceae bacterium]|nr:hypothetical protein [Victivallaceae bacterium]
MDKLFHFLLAVIVVALVLLTASYWPWEWEYPTCNAKSVSGNLADYFNFDAPVWQEVEPYPLQTDTSSGESGDIKFIHCGYDLLCSARLSDSNIVQHGNSKKLLCRSGDVLEIFLQAEKQLCYWEIHFAPDGRTDILFFPVQGDRYGQIKLDGLKTEVKLDGTLNLDTDHDRGWRLLAAIPLDELYQRGVSITGLPLHPEKVPAKWKITVGRYNYLDPNLKSYELSQLIKITAKPNFHQQKSWVVLRMDN